MKRETKGLIEKFEIYKNFIKDRILPIERDVDLNSFLLARYGLNINGIPLEEISRGEKYNIVKKEVINIIKEIKPNGLRERLLEGILLVKQNPNDTGLYSIVLEAVKNAAIQDLIWELQKVSTIYRTPEQLTFNFQKRKTY